MTLELWLLCLAAAIGISLTPGPNGLLSLSHGATFGIRSTVWTVLGAALGFLLVIAASLAGMGALLAASEQAFTIVKWIGAAYLVYLGVRLWRAPVAIAGLARDAATGSVRPLPLFSEGFMVAVSNPKSLIFFAAFLPQFMAPGTSFLVHLLVLGGTFVVVEIVYELLLAGLAQRIAPWLRQHGRMFNRITGSTFMGIGAAMATTSR
jgi:threonine/homoserine/homoserine lactone efflux protein